MFKFDILGPKFSKNQRRILTIAFAYSILGLVILPFHNYIPFMQTQQFEALRTVMVFGWVFALAYWGITIKESKYNFRVAGRILLDQYDIQVKTKEQVHLYEPIKHCIIHIEYDGVKNRNIKDGESHNGQNNYFLIKVNNEVFEYEFHLDSKQKRNELVQTLAFLYANGYNVYETNNKRRSFLLRTQLGNERIMEINSKYKIDFNDMGKNTLR